MVKPLFKKYPDDPQLNLEMAGLYAVTGENAKSRRIARSLEKSFPGNLELLITKLLSFEEEDEFMAETGKLPHPAGKNGFYHTTELFGFEELAIREAIIREDLTDARNRLVRFGFLHGDVEEVAMATAGLMLADIQQSTNSGQPAPSGSFSKVSDRTNAILEASMQGVASMIQEYDEQADQSQTIQWEGPKVGRNDPCPCGSGKKHKKCCL
jgi:hypothetical protein